MQTFFSLKKVFVINRNLLLKLKREATSSETTIENVFSNYFVNIKKSLNIPACNPKNF